MDAISITNRCSRTGHHIRFALLILAALPILGCSDAGRGERYFSETSPSQSAGDDSDAQLLRVGGDHQYPPFEFLNDSGAPDGFNIEILRRLAEIMDLHISIELTAWTEARRRLEAGEIDMLSGMYRTPERDALHDFTVPHFIASYGLFVRDGSPVRGSEDLADATILVHQGDLGHDYAMEHRLGRSVVAVPEWPDVLEALSEGHGDVAIYGMAQGMKELRERGYRNIRMLETPLFERPYAMAVPEGERQLLAKLNEGLSILKSSGEFDEIYQRWFGVLEPRPWWSRRGARMTFIALGALFLMVALAGVWVFALRREVRRKTSQLTTALKESESSKRELEAANQTKLRFLANVSHELRTPLHGVMGMTELLSKTELDNEQRSWLQRVDDASRQLFRVLSDLLDVSRSAAGQLSIEPKDFPLHELPRWLEPTLRDLAETEGLVFDFSTELPEVTVHGDRERIVQILTNLGTNAVKFTEEGTVSLELRYEGEQLAVKVSDSGGGIGEEDITRIFDPFIQTGEGKGHPAGGLGLGLSIVRSLTEEMGGTVEVDSELNRGTTFLVRLPLPQSVSEAQSNKTARPERAPRVSELSVLIAEDEAINRLCLASFLSSSGAKVTQAKNGEEAVRVARTTPCDLILMDVSMPKMDGVEASRRIRVWEKETGASETPIIALTAHAHAKQVQECYDAGMTAYLSKPYRERELYTVIEKVLTGDQP
ncbi:MAG: transporter substrate-binding domain-containing protein [Spirochaetaceae bacterium]